MKKTKKTYYENGNIHVKGELNEKGEVHGITRVYHENGHLKAELSFTNNLQDDGDVISYHNDGSKARQVTLVNHLMNGPYYEWYKNGKRKTEGTYKDKNPTILKEWDKNGILIDRVNGDIYSYYTEANKYYDNEEFNLAIQYINKVLNLILDKNLPTESLSSIVFIAGDESNVEFKINQLYHLRGCAKFKISDDSSIDDFTKVIKIDDDYEDAYYMRGVTYFILLEDWQKSIADIKKYLTFIPDDKAGNQLILVLEEIEENASNINNLYNKSLDYYSKFEDDNFNDIEGNELLKLCIKSLDKASELFTQKNRPNIYLNSHSFSLLDIYFKKLQCFFHLMEPQESIINLCTDIYKTSKGLFKPNKSEIGASVYYLIANQANLDVDNKTSKLKNKLDNKSILRVSDKEIRDVGIVSHFRNKPFNGIIERLSDNGNVIEEFEMVDGLKHGICRRIENGEVVLELNFIDDELVSKGE